MVFVAGVLLVFAAFVFVPLSIALTVLWQRLGRWIADALMTRKWTRAADLGRSISGSIQQLEELPEPPAQGVRHYTVMLENGRRRLVLGTPAAIVVLVLFIGGSIAAALIGPVGDRSPGRDEMDTPVRIDDGGSYDGSVDQGFEDGYYEDGGYYEDDGYDSCVGDCTDMDGDGRTWDDVDADNDGLYETP